MAIQWDECPAMRRKTIGILEPRNEAMGLMTVSLMTTVIS